MCGPEELRIAMEQQAAWKAASSKSSEQGLRRLSVILFIVLSLQRQCDAAQYSSCLQLGSILMTPQTVTLAASSCYLAPTTTGPIMLVSGSFTLGGPSGLSDDALPILDLNWGLSLVSAQAGSRDAPHVRWLMLALHENMTCAACIMQV